MSVPFERQDEEYAAPIIRYGAYPESANGDVEANIAATGRLLAVIEAEAAHPRTLIPNSVSLQDGGKLDYTVPPPYAEFHDPNTSNSSYLVGLGSDGAGQVVMLERGSGGVDGRVVVTLQHAMPTYLSGHRKAVSDKGLLYRQHVDGQLAPAGLLDGLGVLLPIAFDTKRANVYKNSQKSQSGRLIRVAKFITSAITRKPKDEPYFKAIE